MANFAYHITDRLREILCYEFVAKTFKTHVKEGEQQCYQKVFDSAETILTLKNRESIHFAEFAYDTCADTFF